MNDQLIDDLVADLEPVRPVSPKLAAALVGGTTIVAVMAVALLFGLRGDVQAFSPHPIVMLRGGALLLLGSACVVAVAAAARPGVGYVAQGWTWALAAAALFPLTSLFLSLRHQQWPMADLTSQSAPWCIAISTAGGVMVGAVLTLWLRQGAPTSPARAGWLVGLAGGAFGTFSYSLHCPSDTVHYVGIWYSAAVALCAVAGRIVVPRLIRW